jgi:tape measure domain-containing protein
MALPKVGIELVVHGLSEYLSGLRKGTEAVQGFGDTVSRQSSKIDGFREITIGALRQIGALSVELLGSAASSFIDLSRSGFEAVKSYETLSKSLEALTARELLRAGAAKDMTEAMEMAIPVAQENIRWLERLAIISPYEAEDIAGAFRLGAALGFTSDQLKELISRTVDWGAATGQSGAAIERVMLALGQMNTKGKTTGEEMLQLVEAGVSAWDYLAQALGTTTQQAQELVSKGLVPAEFTIQAIASGLGYDFRGAAEASAETLQGLTSSIRDLANRALREAFTPALQAIQPYLVQLVDLLGSPAFLSTVSAIGSSVGVFAKRILELAEGIATAQDPLQALLDVVSLLHPVLGLVIKSAVEIISYFIEMASGGDQVHQSLSNLPRPIQAVVGVLGQLISWIGDTIQVFKDAEDSHQSWAGVVSQAASTVRDVSRAVSDFLQTVFTFIGDFIRDHGSDISGTLVTAWQQIAEIITLTLRIVQTVVTSVLDGVTSFIRSNQGGITSIIRTAWDVISTVILEALTLIEGVLTATLLVIQGDWRGAWDAIISATRNLPRPIQAVVDVLGQLISWIWDTIQVFRDAEDSHQSWAEVVSQAASTVRAVVQAVSNFLQTVFTFIGDFIRDHGSEISETLVPLWQQIAEIITLALEIVQTVVTLVLGEISSFIRSNQGEITTIIRAAWGVISSVILAALTLIKGILTVVLRVIQGDWSGAWDAIVSTTYEVVSWIESALTSLRPVVESAFRAATRAVRQVWDGLVREAGSLGRRLVEGVADGVHKTGSWLAEQVRAALQWALDEAKARLGIRSPSRYTAQILGVPLAEGIAQGILETQAVVSRALQRVMVDSTRDLNVSRSSSIEQSYTSNVSYTYNYAPTYMGGAPPVDVSFDVIRLSLAGGY